MNCVNCGEKNSLYFEKKSFIINQCKQCGLLAVENAPDDLSKFYSKGYFTGDPSLDGYMDYESDKSASRKTYVKFLEKIGSFVKKEKINLFEIGCATGFFLKLAKSKGWMVSGIDISEYAAGEARKNGLDVQAGLVENYTAREKADVVVMLDLLEHVRDPGMLLKKVNALLDVNGILALTTPDSGSLWARFWGKKWHAFVPPQHLFYFSSVNLKSLLEKNGFEVVSLEHHGKWFTVPYIIRLLYSWTGLKLFANLAEKCSVSFLRSVAIPINLGDTIYLVAVKK